MATGKDTDVAYGVSNCDGDYIKSLRQTIQEDQQAR